MRLKKPGDDCMNSSDSKDSLSPFTLSHNIIGSIRYEDRKPGFHA